MRTFFCLLGLLLTITTHAQAQERLTDRGRLLIAGQLGGYWQDNHSWQVSVEPSAAWFFRDHFGVGGYFAYRNLHSKDAYFGGNSKSYEVGVQSVNELALSERLGLFAIVKLGYARHEYGRRAPLNLFPIAAQEEQGARAARSPFAPPGSDAMHVEVFVPLTYHLNANVGVGVGPQLTIDWYPRPARSETRVGAASWIAVSF